MVKWNLFHVYAKLVQYFKINQCSAPYQQTKEKPYDLISGHRKTFNKIQHLFITETLSILGIEGNSIP